MGRSQTKDSDASVSVPARRSARHSKNSDAAIKPSPTVKGTKSIEKEEEVENNNKDVNDTERTSKKNNVKNHDKKSVAGEEASNIKPTTSKSCNVKPYRSKPRSTKKRVLSLSEEHDMNVDSSDEEYDQGDERNRKCQTKPKYNQVPSARPNKAAKIVKQCTYCG